MATRRIRATINNSYTQPLKLKTGRKLVITPNADYNSVLFTKRHKATSLSDYSLKLGVKFNSETFDGIYLTSMLTRDVQPLNASNCTFDIYTISNDGLWTETLVTSVNGVAQGNRFIASASNATLGGIELDGGLSLAVKCTVQRQADTFTEKIYANHLGIFESLFLLKQEVEFLDLTKLDE
jgi:hypothetical protein